MRGHRFVRRAASVPDDAAVIVTCVHGTWARGARWPDLEQAVADVLGDRGPVAFEYFEWSGRNSVRARTRAAADLRQQILEQITRIPRARHVLVAHSHGATVALHALATVPDAEPVLRSALAGVVLLSPPLLACDVVADPVAAANRLLLAAVAVVPMSIVASTYVARWLGLDGPSHLAGLLLIMTTWLLLFRPESIQRRAEALARQLAAPDVDFPGLVVRASGDEAAFALNAVSAFARVARHIWSRVLQVRTPFLRQDDQRLRQARGFRELAHALFEALVLVPMAMSFAKFAQDALDSGRWLTVAAAVPLAIVCATAAAVIVGGSLVLLLMLPVLSILLWPFGIFPTAAAALLIVSVRKSPTPSWQVIDVTKRDRFAWNHSVHQHRDTLDGVSRYVAGRLAPDRVNRPSPAVADAAGLPSRLVQRSAGDTSPAAQRAEDKGVSRPEDLFVPATE